MHKRLLFLTAVLATAASMYLATPASIAAAWNQPFHLGSVQQILINRDRAPAHLARLNWSACLANFAHSQAAAMAARGGLFHGNVLRMRGCRLGSSYLGENVGDLSAGGAALNQNFLDYTINRSFMQSPHHRANIMLRSYRYVGTAWYRAANGTYYIAVEFG